MQWASEKVIGCFDKIIRTLEDEHCFTVLTTFLKFVTTRPYVELILEWKLWCREVLPLC